MGNGFQIRKGPNLLHFHSDFGGRGDANHCKRARAGQIEFKPSVSVYTGGNASFVKMGTLLFAREELREEIVSSADN